MHSLVPYIYARLFCESAIRENSAHRNLPNFISLVNYMILIYKFKLILVGEELINIQL